MEKKSLKVVEISSTFISTVCVGGLRLSNVNQSSGFSNDMITFYQTIMISFTSTRQHSLHIPFVSLRP